MALDNILHRRDYVRHVVVAQAGMQRQRHHALILVVGNREIFRLEPVLIAVVGMQVDRDEVHAGADVARPHFLDELRAVECEPVQIQAQHVQMPRRPHAGPLRRDLQRLVVAECRIVLRDDPAPPLLHRLQPPELHLPNRRLDVGHVVFEAGRDHLVIPRAAFLVAFPGVAAHAVQAQDARLVDHLRRAGEHPALCRGEILGRVEAERGEIAERSDLLPPVGSRYCVGGVLDQVEAALTRQVEQRAHVNRMARIVDWQNRACARRDGLRALLRVDVERVRLDIDQDRRRANMLDDVDRGAEGHRRGDDFVAGADVQRRQREVQPRRTRVQRERALRAEVGGEFLLELPRLRPGRDPVRAQRVHHRCDFFFRDRWRREGEKRRARSSFRRSIKSHQDMSLRIATR